MACAGSMRAATAGSVDERAPVARRHEALERAADAMVSRPKTLGPDTSVAALHRFFADEHVHMALIVDAAGRLLTTIERGDLPSNTSVQPVAIAELGRLRDRTVAPTTPLVDVTVRLQEQGRRRLAVVDDADVLLGLLCLKRDGTGYCSDLGILARSASRLLRAAK